MKQIFNFILKGPKFQTETKPKSLKKIIPDTEPSSQIWDTFQKVLENLFIETNKIVLCNLHISDSFF